MSKFRAKTAIAHPWIRCYEDFWRDRAFALITHQSFDAIHVHDLPLARLGYELSQITKAKFILDLHENWPALLDNATHTKKILGKLLHSPKAWAQYEREYVMKADRIIVVSEMSAERIRPMTNFDRISVVRNTVNLETMPVFGFTRAPSLGPLRLFYGGGINKHRGLQTVIEAMKILERRTGIVNIVLMIVGSGSYKNALQKQATGMYSVWFKKPQSFDKFMSLMAGAHVAIIPHLRNDNNDTTCPHKIFQAMYAGVTVVASDCPYLAAVIEDTGCGFTFEAGNAQALAELLWNLYTDRDELCRGDNGKYPVSKKYNWAKDAEVLTAMYKGLR